MSRMSTQLVLILGMFALMFGCSSENQSANVADAPKVETAQADEKPEEPLELSVDLAQQIERGRELHYAEQLIGRKADRITEELRTKLEEKDLLLHPDQIETSVVWHNDHFVIWAILDSENRVNQVSAYGFDEFVDGERQ